MLFANGSGHIKTLNMDQFKVYFHIMNLELVVDYLERRIEEVQFLLKDAPLEMVEYRNGQLDVLCAVLANIKGSKL